MNKSALLVIDVQNVYTDKKSELFCKDSTSTIAKINKLIEVFSKKNWPVVYIRHQHKKDGSDAGLLFDFEGGSEDVEIGFVAGSNDVKYDKRLTVLKDGHEIVKTRYSAFKKTNLDALLKKLKVKRVAICGFMTNFCCESTAREALDLDYYVDFVLDATGTPGTENMDQDGVRLVVGELLAAGFARVCETKEYITDF